MAGKDNSRGGSGIGIGTAASGSRNKKSRLSGGTKKAIKTAKQSGMLTAAQAQVVRKQLRKGVPSTATTNIVGRKVTQAQVQRSIKRRVANRPTKPTTGPSKKPSTKGMVGPGRVPNYK